IETMITSWMLYAGAISILISIAALAADQGLSARGLPTRWVWAAAALLSVVWPLGSVLRRLFPAPAAVSVLPFTIVVQTPAMIITPSIGARIAALLDRGLAMLWIALSLALLVRLARGVVALERMRAEWKRSRIDGVAVKLSDNVGPAVVGLRTMDVVLPEWIFSLDASLRAIVLRHEEEHRRARDPHLLFGAALAVAAMPWNPLLWLQARRLRLAIEMDCDARVLRAHPSPERYGMLLLTIAQRRSISPAIFAPMMTEPTTQLERRILAMRRSTRKLARLTMYSGGVIAALVLAFASSLQSAGVPLTDQVLRAVQPVLNDVPTVAPRAILARPHTEVLKLDPVVSTSIGGAVAQQGNPAPRYPDMLRTAGVEGSVLVRFYTDGQGVPDLSSLAVVSSSHDLFTNAVKSVLPKWRLAPNASIQSPFLFLMRDKTADQLRTPGHAVVIDGVSSANAIVIVAAPEGTAPGWVVTGRRTDSVVAFPAQPTRVTGEQTYFEFQVEHQATQMPGNAAPRYPDMLRQAKVEGVVLAQFVLNTDGTPDMETFKVLKSTHDLFTQAVKDALPA